MEAAKRDVIGKICGKGLPPLENLDAQLNQIVPMLAKTIEFRQGSSLVVMGPRSTGKTLLVEHALASLEESHPGQYIVVRLNGFAQTDDKMGLREICRQLDIQLATELKVPDSFARNGVELLERKSLSETMQGFLRLFSEQKNGQDTVAVIFVLEELDRFAQHSRQSLLYTLFDLPHSSNMGVSVIGLTSRINLREMLEKRVRSRFSNRVVAIERPKTLDMFWQVCRASLHVTSGDVPTEVAFKWNSHLDELYNDKASRLFKIVEAAFYTTKDPRQVNYECLYEISQCHDSRLPFASEDIDTMDMKCQLATVPATADTVLAGLTELQLALLICAARAQIKFESDTLNFNLVYDEYKAAAKAEQVRRKVALTANSVSLGHGYRIWSKAIAQSAWEELEQVDLVVSLSAAASTNKKPGNAVTDDLRMVKVDVDLRELGKVVSSDSPLYSWVTL